LGFLIVEETPNSRTGWKIEMTKHHSKKNSASVHDQ
jgi:hypothetical protein